MSANAKAANGAINAVLTSSSGMFWYLLIVPLVLVYLYWRVSRRHMLQLAEKIPGPKGWPLIGNLLDILGSPVDVFNMALRYSEKYDGIVKAWGGPVLVIFLTDPRDVEIILSSHVYVDKSYEYRFFQPWLGDGLVISKGNKWRAHRRLITPTFHLNVLKGYIDYFNSNSREIVEKMRKEEGKTFDCHYYMAEAALGMLLETTMGVSKNIQGCDVNEYAMAVMKLSDILHLRHTKLWLRFDWTFNLSKYKKQQEKLLSIIKGLTRQVVKNKRDALTPGIRGSTGDISKGLLGNREVTDVNTETKTVTKGGDLDVDDSDVSEKKRLAFLDHMIESSLNGAGVTDEELRDEVDTILFAGYDTIALTCSFFLSLMGIHGEIQENVIREMDDIFGDSDRPATFADTLEMKYLERCIFETLRVYPTIPIIARQVKQDVKMASGDYTLPAGCTIVIGTFKIHRRPEIYPNPDIFNPDHFLPERMANRHHYAFIPFSAGPRNCLGIKYTMLALKILLSTIMRHFRVISDLKEKDFQLKTDLTLKRAEGFPIRLQPRKPTNKTS